MMTSSDIVGCITIVDYTLTSPTGRSIGFSVLGKETEMAAPSWRVSRYVSWKRRRREERKGEGGGEGGEGGEGRREGRGEGEVRGGGGGREERKEVNKVQKCLTMENLQVVECSASSDCYPQTSLAHDRQLLQQCHRGYAKSAREPASALLSLVEYGHRGSLVEGCPHKVQEFVDPG